MLFFTLLLSLSAAAEEPMRICYFSLNEENEFTVTKQFVDKLNAQSSVKVEVKEFQPRGANPEQAFKKMVESGVRCDGLVISGHHTGSYGGHRAKGKLSMDFIESLSCDPKYADWFRNVNAAWLQGCRTLGVGEIATDDPQGDADFHTLRVGRVVEEDGLDQNFSELNMEFSSTLDQDNPLASRYLRMFPAAKLFGWTKSAPGEKSRSWMSVLYHIAHIAKKLDEEDQFPAQGPEAPSFTPETAGRYANAVLAALQKSTPEDHSCEDVAVGAWLSHGNVGQPEKYFFDNPDLKSLHSLAASRDGALLEAKEIECLLKAAAREKNVEKMGRVLDRILSRPEFLRFSFNTIVDLKNELGRRQETSGLAGVILAKMKDNAGIQAFLAEKLKARQVGIVRKMDYYQFYRELTGNTDPALEQEIQSKAIALLMEPLPELTPGAANPARSRNLAADYRATVFQAVVKNRLASHDFYDQLLARQPEADVLKSMAAQASRFRADQATNLLMEISGQPKADAKVGDAVLRALWEMKVPREQFEAYRQDIYARLGFVDKNGVVHPPVQASAEALPNTGNLLKGISEGLGNFFKPKDHGAPRRPPERSR